MGQPDKNSLSLFLRAAGMTDAGCVRAQNEDAFLADTVNGIFIVADGISGRRGGAIASQAVVRLIPDIIKRQIGGMPTSMTCDNSAILELLEGSVLEASRIIRSEGEQKFDTLGMGSTVAVTLMARHHAYIAHLGDCRAYLLRGSEFRRLTDDHTIIAALLRHGDISFEEAVDHPAKGRLTRFAGMEPAAEPSMCSLVMEAGDRFLLCTDGLWGAVDDAQLNVFVTANKTPAVTCRNLIAAGKQAGGHDNLTAVVVDVVAD